MILLVFQRAGADHRRLGVGDLPAGRLLFVLFHKNLLVFFLFCALERKICFTRGYTYDTIVANATVATATIANATNKGGEAFAIKQKYRNGLQILSPASESIHGALRSEGTPCTTIDRRVRESGDLTG